MQKQIINFENLHINSAFEMAAATDVLASLAIVNLPQEIQLKSSCSHQI